MDEEFLAREFDAHRERLRAVGFRMLGSAAEADDAVQETWFKVARADTESVDNLGGWLTTVMSRVCLDMLRARSARHEVVVGEPVEPPRRSDSSEAPEDEAVLADSIGIAMMVVLDALGPAERLAFVLHDMFGMPFDEIAPVVGRSPAATRQLASRARRRVRGARTASAGAGDPRRVVDAFLVAAREGRFEDLLAVLDPDVVLRADTVAAANSETGRLHGGPALEPELRGADAVAHAFHGRARGAVPATIDGVPGAAWAPGGIVRSVFRFTVEDGRIVALEVIADPEAITTFDTALL
ncbi:RNA polymerase sigma 70 [Rhodococcus pyridinivorans SB3094]|uniref:RNA polymerase sigma 70 n=1 Tax=Rhodococcus pyridinivorans SB3094 TaxID=1435356 RepID=V9XIB8_9NOCA|nr:MULTISPECIES: sigma-70 family RNA polymerase sigma factor [Rhodococcus]AHD23211.1 RNA polymerase sigma 70 [Rhodococcus pyridinivorans SB3094]MCT7291796.1 sigma-70 family RNA polymerase sigma factor [Rhodococcus sp. PAE-6]